MEFRTDLALEAREACPDCSGVEQSESSVGDVTLTKIRVSSRAGAKAMGKPIGSYITISMPPITDHSFMPDERYETVADSLAPLLPEKGLILVAGLGNVSITPDALGPRTASLVSATRHITAELERSAGFTALRPTAVIQPGVLGQTGIETLELIRSVCEAVKPAAVIVIDAMASRRLARLGCTVQLSDAGVSPGAGVGNNRAAISEKELGMPVISIGVPTVVEATTLARDIAPGCEDAVDEVQPRGAGMIVTPREIDLLISRASRLLALAIDRALHPEIDPVELMLG